MGSRTPAAIAANHESCFVGSRLRTDDLFRIVCSTAKVDAGARASNAIFILVVTKLARIIEEVAKFLPEQAPLHTFVHHNTLHAFEHMGFDDAVVAAMTVILGLLLLGCLVPRLFVPTPARKARHRFARIEGRSSS